MKNDLYSVYHLSISYFLHTGMLKSTPLLFSGRHAVNGGMMAANLGAYGYFMSDHAFNSGMTMLSATTGLSSVMGVTLTMAIGGEF